MNTALLLSGAGTRSAATTPPVMFCKVHAVAATFATKLFEPSLVTAKTVIEEPEVSDWAGTMPPVPFAAVSTLTVAAGPGVTVIVPEGVGVNAPEVALMSAVPIT